MSRPRLWALRAYLPTAIPSLARANRPVPCISTSLSLVSPDPARLQRCIHILVLTSNLASSSQVTAPVKRAPAPKKKATAKKPAARKPAAKKATKKKVRSGPSDRPLSLTGWLAPALPLCFSHARHGRQLQRTFH